MRANPLKYTLTLACILPLAALAQETKDVLRDAVDPFNIAKERSRFIQAQGSDNDLDPAEFELNAKADNPFVRPYDKWANLALFDGSTGTARDGKIDWSEAQNYRRALRNAVFNAYDKDASKSFNDQERAAANADLAAGKTPKLDTPPVAAPEVVAPGAGNPPGGPGMRNLEREERLARYDLDGDGRLNEQERFAMGEDERRRVNEQMLNQYDKDGDGKLSAEERAGITNPQVRMAMRFQDLLLPHADLDGNGQIDPNEQQSLIASGQKVRAIGEQWRMNILDTNKDGAVSPEEEQFAQQKFQAAAVQMLPKAITWFDNNGDGMVDEQERQAGVEKMADTAEQQIQAWTAKYDADGNGRLNEQERDQLIDGFKGYMEGLYFGQDGDGDGQLSVPETVKFLDALAAELGLGQTKQ